MLSKGFPQKLQSHDSITGGVVKLKMWCKYKTPIHESGHNYHPLNDVVFLSWYMIIKLYVMWIVLCVCVIYTITHRRSLSSLASALEYITIHCNTVHCKNFVAQFLSQNKSQQLISKNFYSNIWDIIIWLYQLLFQLCKEYASNSITRRPFAQPDVIDMKYQRWDCKAGWDREVVGPLIPSDQIRHAQLHTIC